MRTLGDSVGLSRVLRGRRYSTKKSTGEVFAPLHPLTRFKLISSPDLVVISALLCPRWLLKGLRKTKRDSLAECSALKRAGSPMTIEVISSGKRSDVV